MDVLDVHIWDAGIYRQRHGVETMFVTVRFLYVYELTI
jgi:hypothetical protein